MKKRLSSVVTTLIKGLSSVVTTLIIIVLVLVAIGIVWIVVKNIVINQSEFVETQKEFFSESVRISALKINKSLVSISLRRIGGDIKIETEGEKNETVEIVEADIISVVDLSGSMRSCNGVSSSCCSRSLNGDYSSDNCNTLNLDKENNCTFVCGGEWVDRLSAAQDANKELINILSQAEGSRIGLVGYNTTAVNSASFDLTDDLIQLNNKIDSWNVGGTTCICCGINEALRKLQQQSSGEKVKKIIVMSDGEANVKCAAQNTGNAAQDAIKASCDAKANLENLTVYSIGVGENANEGTLVNISNCGGGKYFSAINISELIDVYRRVAEEIKTTYKSTNKFILFIIFYSKTSSYKERILEIPEVLIGKDYNFNLTGKLEGNITKIEIYPVVVLNSGEEVIGPLFDVWNA
ncbi:MAG: VWA domain-containing protein [Candidatus Pacearchaeota archaeon]|nr:VWA domain-containing protein [Candidatus Pacearchaeota archaeon]